MTLSENKHNYKKIPKLISNFYAQHGLGNKVVYHTRAIITRGLYPFYPLFEVNLCTVTFGLMYG